ncbi:MAG: hypothetical protein ACOVQM_03370 [Pirellula sp.]
MVSNNQSPIIDEEPNVVLAPEEIATLGSLMSQYDQLLADMDELNLQIETLLKAESPAAPVAAQE